MDVALTRKTEDLAAELAQNVRTLEELNTAMRSLMKSSMERMLNTEMDVHLGRRQRKGEKGSGLILWSSPWASFAFEAQANGAAFCPLIVSEGKSSFDTVADRFQLSIVLNFVDP